MSKSPFPIVSGTQMSAVDKAMVDVCGLELMQVMETAGRAVAIVARSMWNQSHRGPIVILCGNGGNGGDGFVCGRYLFGWGIAVELWLVRPSAEYAGLAGHQLQTCRKIGMAIVEPHQAPLFDAAALIIDGVFGFGLSKPPAGRAAELIVAANKAAAPILAIDLPSGIDANTGAVLEPAIVANVTVTLGLPKLGLVTAAGPEHAGEIIVADIGIPAAAYANAGVPETEVFRDAEFRRLSGEPWQPLVRLP